MITMGLLRQAASQGELPLNNTPTRYSKGAYKGNSY